MILLYRKSWKNTEILRNHSCLLGVSLFQSNEKICKKFYKTPDTFLSFNDITVHKSVTLNQQYRNFETSNLWS